jgi:peptide/nickel transport system substrate-binding protein
MVISRRAVLGAAASLPFLSGIGRAQNANRPLRYGLAAYPPHMRVWVNGGASQGVIKMLTQRALLAYDASGKLVPELAESWRLDEKGAWVVRLREGALFQNGKPVTVEDVKWTLERVAAEGSEALMAPQFKVLDKVEIVDPRTVRIVTKAPSPILPSWLAAREMPIVWQGSADTEPVGAGPFRITAAERGTSYDLVAFEKYYKPGLPKLKAIKAVVYSDESLRAAALHAGDLDFIESVPWQAMDAIAANPKLKLMTMPGGFQMLQFNGTSGPLADVRVRRAIAHSIRRDEIVKAAFFGRGEPMEMLPIVKGTPWYDETLAHGWNYDQAKAKALLAEAGYARGFNISILSTTQSGWEKVIAEILQQCFADIGITATLNMPDQTTRNTLRARGQFEIYSGGSVSNDDDPDSLTASLVQSPGIDVAKTKSALDRGRLEMDPVKRAEIYKEMQRAAYEEVPMVGMAWRAGGYAMARYVEGFTVLPGPLLRNSDHTIENVYMT